MKLLLETHIFLWFVSAASQLPTRIRDLIRDPFDRLLICQAI